MFRSTAAYLCALLTCAACVEGSPGFDAAYAHAGEPIGTVREIYDGTLSPELAATTFRNTDRLFPTRRIAASAVPRPLPASPAPLTALQFTEGDSVHDLERYLERNRVAALVVLHDGRVAIERYRLGATAATRWMSMSIAKSITSTLIGAALREGSISSLDDPVTRYVRVLRGSAYEGVSVRHILQMTSGVGWSEAYTDPSSDRRRLLEAQLSQVPGSAMRVMRTLARVAEPGARFNYSTGETQVAAELVRGAIRRPLSAYLSDKIWQPAGMESDATWWLDSPRGIEIGGSGISATARDYARFGQFILEDGVVGADTILPAGWVREATTPLSLADRRVVAFGYSWWTASTPASRRGGAFNAEGIHGQFIVVDPTARVVIVVLSARPHPTADAVISDYAFFDAVVSALASPTQRSP
jgi:CubicO group peptidase (beta-lactamase class C family)